MTDAQLALILAIGRIMADQDRIPRSLVLAVEIEQERAGPKSLLTEPSA